MTSPGSWRRASRYTNCGGRPRLIRRQRITRHYAGTGDLAGGKASTHAHFLDGDFGGIEVCIPTTSTLSGPLTLRCRDGGKGSSGHAVTRWPVAGSRQWPTWRGHRSAGSHYLHPTPPVDVSRPTARHPMVFTRAQWRSLPHEELFVGAAAPMWLGELGRNHRYVFALPARYNYAFPTRYEEVEKILSSNPLHGGCQARGHHD